MLKRSKEYEKKCKEICSDKKYQMLKKSFFNKEENLKKINSNLFINNITGIPNVNLHCL